MSFIDEMRSYTQNKLAEKERAFPETGDNGKAEREANGDVTVILMSLRAKIGYPINVVKEGFKRFYIYELDRYLSVGGETYSNWSAAEVYFHLVEDALNKEGIYHEWYIENSLFGQEGKFQKQPDLESFLRKMHDKLKGRWELESRKGRIGNSSSVSQKWKVISKIQCDSKGVVI